MPLLNVHTLELKIFGDNEKPPYVITSHRWLDDEVTYKDVFKRRNEDKAGFRKVQSFCDFVKDRMPKAKCEWLWIDTCCIDKSSSSELQEAINSMFRWYAEALVCVAYLHDVKPQEVMRTFETSVWFSRGWTLQELLAPSAVIFLDACWEPFGVKTGDTTTVSPLPFLNEDISYITGIPEDILDSFANSKSLSVEQKQQWMSGRKTTRVEDLAYCQLGILGVFMPLIYGSQDEAMVKLKEELKKKPKRVRARTCENRASRRIELEPPARYHGQDVAFALRDWGGDLLINFQLGHCLLKVELLHHYPGSLTPWSAFCTFQLHGKEVFRSRVVKNDCHHVWNEFFEISIRSTIRRRLTMIVWEDHRLGKAKAVETALLPVAFLEPFQKKECFIPLTVRLGGGVRLNMFCKPTLFTSI